MPLYNRPVKEAPSWDPREIELRYPSPPKYTPMLVADFDTILAQPRALTSRRTAVTREPIAVLFVDERNRARSLIAHAQAEITRLWTLNQQGRNLFSAVDSAGLHLDTSLTRKGSWRNHRAGEKADDTTVEAVMGEPQFKEGEDLKHRFVQKHITRGIEFEDFDRFDYILAFDTSTLTDLRNLEWVAYRRALARGRDGLRAKTKYIGEFNSSEAEAVRIHTPSIGRSPSPRDYRPTTRLIERELHNFLHAATGWTKPDRILLDTQNTRYRSRQFLARQARVTDAKLRTIKLLHGGKVTVDEDVPGREFRVVTVYGREGPELRLALEDARAAFL